jgi:hypothetical protein
MKRFFVLLFLTSLFWLGKQSWPARTDWMLERIRADLARIDARSLHPSQLDLVAVHDANRAYARIRIKKNRLDATLIHPYNGSILQRFTAITRTLQRILSTVDIPDVDALICLEDACDHADLPAPVFAFAKNKTLEENVLLLPDFEIMVDGRLALLRKINKHLARVPWHKRRAMAVWRGSSTGAQFSAQTFLTLPRAQLVSLSFSYPEFLNARFSSIDVQCFNPEQLWALFPHYCERGWSIQEHLSYKYQILIDGNTAPYSRAFWQLFSQSLIFKIDSPNIQWYSHRLIPYEHYVPVAADLHDLIDKIKWAQTHEREAKNMRRKSWEFAHKHLKRAEIDRYIQLALTEYANIQKLRECE